MRHSPPMRIATAFFCLIVALASVTHAQTTQDLLPAAGVPRQTLTLPPGFVLVEGARGKAICEPADRDWVQETLSAPSAATRPSTMPSDLLSRWQTSRDQVIARIAADYAIADSEPLAKRLDDATVPDLRKLEGFSPPLFFLATTQQKIKDLLRNDQWANPGFSYNRLADEILFRKSVTLTLERPMDDTVMDAFFEPDDGVAARSAKLSQSLDAAKNEVEQSISGRAMFAVHTAMIEVIVQEVFAPLKLPRDQQWLGVGLPAATSADYAEQVIGSPRKELLLMLSAELRNNPIKARSINLLDPAEPGSLKRQYAIAYADAFRRKCVAATLPIVEKQRDKLPELMRSLRITPCKTGQELLQRILQVTGVDVSNAVTAK